MSLIFFNDIQRVALEITSGLGRSGREKQPSAELDATDRTPSRLGSATPTGRFTAANPWQTLRDPARTRRRSAAAPVLDGSKLLAVTWRLDDWRRVDGFVGSPRSLPRLFLACLFSFVRHLHLLRFHPVPLSFSSSSSFSFCSSSPLVHLSICSSMYVRTYGHPVV